MTAIGSVKHLLTSKDGDIGGIVLSSGTIVDTPRGHGDALRALLKRGDVVKVEGVESRSERGRVHVRAKRIALSPRRPSREDRAKELKPFEATADGYVESFAVNPAGDVTGLRLEDGTVVVTPLRVSENLIAQVAVGDYVHVEGHRVVSSRHDIKIVANRILVRTPDDTNDADESIFEADDHLLRA